MIRPQLTDALARAFFVEWARVGYAALSLEGVARRARVGKAALYRRWSSKADMAGDLLMRNGLTLTETADQGSLEGDIHAFLLAIRRVLRHRLVRRILADLHAGIVREPTLAATIRPLQQARRRRAEAVVDRAIARGELPAEVDRDIVSDLLAAPLYWRLIVIGGRSDRQHVETLARMLAAAAMAGSARPAVDRLPRALV